jgi:GWxTD domain-containing protein
VVKERMLNQDMAYIYDPTQTIIKKKIQFSNDSIRVFLSFTDPNNQLSKEDFSRRYRFFYKITADYESSAIIHKDSISVESEDLAIYNNACYLSFGIRRPEIANSLLIVERFDRKRKILDLIDIPLVNDSAFGENTFMAYYKNNNIPLIDNYILKNDSFIVKASGQWDYQKTNILYFSNSFPPAIKPYKSTEEIEDPGNMKGGKSLVADISNGFSFPAAGLYYLSSPKSKSGFSLMAVDNKFPKISRPEEMLTPLYYICSEEESARMSNSLKPKFTLDSFWLSIGGSEDYSRKLIKTFYQKVEYANRSFTSHKEGWKTDRGMIYIIFGKPDAVYRHNDQEEWDYENVSDNSLTFSFRKRNDLYSNDDEYELVRKPVYESYWKFMVERWRKGNIIK